MFVLNIRWFLSRVSTLPHDIDIAILSVRLSVRDVPVLGENGLTYCHSFQAPHFTLVKEALIEIGCVVTSLVVGWLVVGRHARALWPNGAS